MQLRGLPAALGAATMLVVPQAAAAASPCRGASASARAITPATAESAVRCLLNRERHAHGLGALSAEHRLHGASVRFARQMVARRFFAHVGPDGRTLLDRLRSARYVTSGLRRYAIAENLAYGRGGRSTPRSIVSAWMHSAGHRANILDPRFRHVGIGAVDGSPVGDGGARTFVADFGLRVR